MTYDLSTQDRDKLVSKQSLSKGKKLTLKKTLQPMTTQSATQSATQSYILADISGSMHGSKFTALQDALHDVWRSGIHGIAFGSHIYDFDEADIDSLSVTGTTNMLEALQAAWDDKVDHIVLLTDGQPDQSEDEILTNVRLHQDIPIDTIGIGDEYDEYNAAFLQKMSDLTNGRFNSVSEPLLLSEVMSELLQITEVSTSGTISL